MTLELKWLIYTALLAGSLWIPFIVGVNTTDFPGKAQLFIRPPDHGQMKPWVHRSLRAPEYAGAVRSFRYYRTRWCSHPRIDARDGRVFDYLFLA
jgi:hypothetical protein